MSELTRGQRKLLGIPSDDHILTKSIDGGRMSFLDHPVRGVVDEITALNQTEVMKDEALREYFGTAWSTRRKTTRSKELPHWLPYPYDLVQHIDKNEALLPGLAHIDFPQKDQRKDWTYTDTMRSDDGKELLIGALRPENGYVTQDYVLDPHTMRAITPAFDRLITFDNDHAVLSIPNYRGEKYELTATKALSDAVVPKLWQVDNKKYAATPDFLRGTHLSLRRAANSELAVLAQPESAIAPIDDNDIFGLEPLGASANARGRQVFEAAFKNIAAFATVDQELRTNMQQPNEVLTLPWVKSPRIDAQLHFTTYPDGGGQLSLGGMNNDLRVTLSAKGDVIIGMYGVSSRELRSTDAEFSDCINAIDGLLREYFTRLYEENTTIDAEKLRDLRQKLGKGGMAGWFATHTLKRNYKRQ